MPIDMDSYLGLHTRALQLRSQRAGILATNLANADTPNFKARDMDFRAVLERAAQDPAPVRMRRTDPRHLALPRPDLTPARLKYRVPQQAALDGNTVDVQVERSKFTENALHYQADLRFLSGRINGMIKALRGE